MDRDLTTPYAMHYFVVKLGGKHIPRLLVLTVWNDETMEIRKPMIQRSLVFFKRLMGFSPYGFLSKVVDKNVNKEVQWVVEYKHEEGLDWLGSDDSNEDDTEVEHEAEDLIVEMGSLHGSTTS
ncbi:hypothetical protein SUGI_0685760 [Cryptomeria japonica]|nr:hypothetical protein SUGI_0685760 [Cryptomeria japonica]